MRSVRNIHDQLAEIGNATVYNFVEQYEEDQDEDLCVIEALLDLVPLDLLVEHTSLRKTSASDEQSLLLQRKEPCGQYRSTTPQMTVMPPQTRNTAFHTGKPSIWPMP
jgi:hypothetical protein